MADPGPVLPPSAEKLDEMRRLRDTFEGFMMNYQFGIEEVLTKINVLRAEFEHLHEYSPIEHVSSRLKSPESIFAKHRRHGGPVTLSHIRKNVRDIAGVRVVCSFIKDAYMIAEALTAQRDVQVIDVKDYIKNPKPNGYRSLHLIVEIPVFLSSRSVNVPIEIQIRTIAMDFWASLEHKIYYKFETEVPDALLAGLQEAAQTAARLDVQMEQIHDAVRELRPVSQESLPFDDDDDLVLPSAEALRNLFSDG